MMQLFQSFTAPAALGLLALGPIIVLLYLLKLKRRPLTVSSTLLWRRSVQDMIANAPFQKLRNNLLLWLQLLILLLLVLALARPVMRLTSGGGETIIILIDQSASMSTREEDGKTRFEKAQEEARKVVEAMSSGSELLPGRRDAAMIIGIGQAPVPLQPLTDDKGALRDAIDRARPLDATANLTDLSYILKERTMKVVDGALVPNEETRVVLISDGGLGPTVAALNDVVNVDFRAIGSTTDNVGFTGLDVRESFSGTVEYQVFASLYNSAATPKSVLVDLNVDGNVLDLKKVDLPARGNGGVVFTVGESVRGLATVSLVDHRDPFPLDDQARAIVSAPTELRVLVVSRGNSFLESVFNVDPRTKVSTIRPDAYTVREDYDITVFDNASVPAIPPLGNFIFVNALPPADAGFKASSERVERPRVIDWSRVDPLTRYTNFDRVLIGESMALEPPAAATALVQAVETDLISLLEQETRRILVIGFDINRSYWPVDVSFPIFFSNLIDHWSRTGRGLTRPAYSSGETVAILPPRDAKGANVTSPDGRVVSYDLTGKTTFYLTDTQRSGVYTVKFDDNSVRQVPVNLGSNLESDILPVDSLTFGGRTVTATQGDAKTLQDIWPWLALVGLGILMLEWGIYCRRTFM